MDGNGKVLRMMLFRTNEQMSSTPPYPSSCLPRRRIICEKRVRRSSRSISSRRPSHGECYGFCADLRGRGLESAGMSIYRRSIVYKFWRYMSVVGGQGTSLFNNFLFICSHPILFRFHRLIFSSLLCGRCRVCRLFLFMRRASSVAG